MNRVFRTGDRVRYTGAVEIFASGSLKTGSMGTLVGAAYGDHKLRRGTSLPDEDLWVDFFGDDGVAIVSRQHLELVPEGKK